MRPSNGSSPDPQAPRRARRRRPSLRALLIVPFLLQLFAVTALVSWLSVRNGRRAVEEVTLEVRRELTGRIWEYLVAYLEAPHRLNALNALALELGEIDAGDPEALGRHFRRQLDELEAASFIFLGTPEGGAAGAGRNREGRVVVDTTDLGPGAGLVGGSRYEYAADAFGQRGRLLKSTPGFDARERPWFRAAVEAGGPAWSPIYTFFAERSLAVAASRPVYADGGELRAVLGVDLTLSRVADFLRTLEVGKSGRTFVVERSGELVASSAAEEPFVESPGGDGLQRLRAAESSEPLVAGAARFLGQRPGGLEAIAEARHLEVEIGGERHFLDVSPLGGPHGLDWLIVVVIPEADYLAPIAANTRLTLWLCAGAVALAVGLGVFTSRQVTRPVERLSLASAQLADGQLETRVEEEGAARELDALAAAFNRMAGQLRAAFRELEARVEERTAELREAKEEADRANAAKSRFLASMSHEIRTPLAAVLGYVELLGDPRKTPRESERYLRTVRQQGQHLNQLLSDLLDLSRIEAGRLELEPEVCRLEEVLTQLASAFAPRARERGLELFVRTDARLPWRFEIDPVRLRQVLSNLLSNAVKYTERGSVTLSVECGPEPPAERESERATLVFRVIDTGVGIDVEAQRRLFRTFTQLDPSSERRSGGFGLGLSIVRQLVDLMGGEVSVDSRSGAGSTFSVSLPVEGCGDWRRSALRYQAGREVEQLTGLPPLGGRILIADDSAALQELCRKMLESWGLRCETADDGLEAVERALGGSFDAILMDWQMPGIDGLEATRRLRAEGVTAPIVALTAAAMAGDRERCLAAGCDAYLLKPIDFKTLHRWLSRLLESSGSGSAGALEASDGAEDEEMADLVRRYAESLPERMDELAGHLEGGDWRAFGAGVHRLAGTAGTYGLSEVFAAAQELEEVAVARDAAAARRSMERLETAVGRALGSPP